METPRLQSKPKEITYFKLNNELNRPVDGKIPLNKDREAVHAYFLEHVNPNTVFFHSLQEKLHYLINNDYIEREFIELYSGEFVKKVFQKAYAKKIPFPLVHGSA